MLLYPLPVWEEIEAKLQALPSLNQKVRRIQRLLIGHASEVEIDPREGFCFRILRQFAQVEKVMIVGQGNKFELWSEQNWTKNCQGWLQQGKDMQRDGEEMPDELSSISV